MTYWEFIDYLKKRAHDELGFDYELMEFHPEGFTPNDPEMKKIVRDCNMLYFGKENESLLSDFLIFKYPCGDDSFNLIRLAIKNIYENASKIGQPAFEKEFDLLREQKEQLDASDISIESAIKRSGSDYDAIRGDLIIRPLNFGLHAAQLRDCIYKRVGDFALVLYQLLGDSGKVLSTSKIRKEDLERWNMTGHEEEILSEALENSMRIFPACVPNRSMTGNADLMNDVSTIDDIGVLHEAIMLSTTNATNGAVSLFYPGVAEKIMEIKGGPFTAVFMNINDIMIFDLDSPRAKLFVKQASKSSIMGEMLSKRIYRVDEDGIHPV